MPVRSDSAFNFHKFTLYISLNNPFSHLREFDKILYIITVTFKLVSQEIEISNSILSILIDLNKYLYKFNP